MQDVTDHKFEETSNAKRAMVLLVDDQALVGESLRRMLAAEEDLDFHFCADASKALQQACRIRPTVILQDLVMPGVNGLDLVRKFRSHDLLRDVPVIVLSVREEPETKRDAFAAGASDYLVKLPDRLEMLARLRYHTRAFLAQRDRDLAMRALRESQRELVDSNTELISLNQKLESATKTKSEFLAMMSHEIRTPLNGVLGFSDLLAETLLDEEQRNFVETIRSSGRTLLNVIDDVLDFSKIEAGKMAIASEVFEIKRTVREACELFLPGARGNGSSLEWEVDSSLPERVLGDPLRLRQVISNLVSNAVKFTRSGQIRISVEFGDVHELSGAMQRYFPPPDDGEFFLRVSVADTGIGIPPEKVGQLFKAFDQLAPGTARKFGGSGLGLAICRKLCQLMGGEIWTSSDRGQGSEFVFMVKMAPAPARAAGDVAPASGPDPEVARCLSGSRVVVAEDNEVNARLMVSLLKKFAVHARIVTNGALAVEAAIEDNADLIFMDIQMPELDGREATAAIRAAERSQGRPACYIVALTAEAMQGDAAKCLAAGMNAYLAKPLKLTELAAALAKYCSHRSSLTS
ncbi:MAG TPA: response regulator [Terrimicrobiaceae bacterium]|nr:response regulator [Terrimicrobiaceae bacterium]